MKQGCENICTFSMFSDLLASSVWFSFNDAVHGNGSFIKKTVVLKTLLLHASRDWAEFMRSRSHFLIIKMCVCVLFWMFECAYLLVCLCAHLIISVWSVCMSDHISLYACLIMPICVHVRSVCMSVHVCSLCACLITSVHVQISDHVCVHV